MRGEGEREVANEVLHFSKNRTSLTLNPDTHTHTQLYEALSKPGECVSKVN